MNKTRAIAMAALVVLALIGAGGAGASQTDRTVYTRGDEVLEPNTFVRADLRFSPGPLGIDSGGTIAWVHDDMTLAPHTVTLATPDQLVGSFEDFFGCVPCAAAAGAALAGHFPGGPPVLVLDPDGDGAFDSPGDSLLFFPNGSISAEIGASPDTTLLYFCAFHPWMQGTIEVN
jgi:plastocyanin